MTVPAVIAVRRPASHPRSTPAEQEAYDRYLAGRNHYKEELLDEVAAAAGGGPVLEVGSGYGGLGVELLRRGPLELHVVCESDAARRLYERRLTGAGLRARLHTAPGGVPDPEAPDWRGRRFAVVFSANAFNGWPDPAGALRRLAALRGPGGLVVVNDLRRDPDPFILEYSLRDMADDTSEEGRYRLTTYLASLRGAYTLAEAGRLPASAGPGEWQVAADGPMALCLRLPGTAPPPAEGSSPTTGRTL